MKNDLRFKEKEVDDQTGKYQLLEKESKSLIDRAKHLNEQVDQKAISVDKTSQRLESVDRDIVSLKQAIISIDVDINDVERSNDRNLELQKKLLRQKDGELQRGQENS